MRDLERKSRRFRMTIPSGQAATPEIQMRDEAMGIVVFPSTWPGDDISVQVYSEVDDDWVLMYDESGNLLTTTGTAAAAANLPDKIAAADRMRLVNTAAGVVTNVGSDATLELILKS